MPSVFLSYARGDDDEFVARAYEFLRADFDVWWDKECMPSRSLTFTEEIRDAIHRSERVVVVIGPKALRSDYVRAEWQAALSERKPVIPLLRRGAISIASFRRSHRTHSNPCSTISSRRTHFASSRRSGRRRCRPSRRPVGDARRAGSQGSGRRSRRRDDNVKRVKIGSV